MSTGQINHWAAAMVCMPAIACGGTTGPTVANLEAGVDSSVADAGPLANIVTPSDSDPCTDSQRFEYQPIANFDYLNPQGLAIISSSVYVSYDGSGVLFEGKACRADGTGCSIADETATDVAAENMPFCSNCVPQTDGGGCENCGCTTGYNGGPELAPQPRCGAQSYGLHLRANAANGGPLSGWGMNVGIDLRQNCGGPTPTLGTPQNPCFFDATAWTGISFWALLGGPTTSQVGLATIEDPMTASVLGETTTTKYPDNTLLCGDPACAATFGTGVQSTRPQCDPYGQAVGLVNQWTFYAIPFSDMAQKGYGLVEPGGPDLAHLLGFKFGLGKGTWDVWLNNISFYRLKTSP